MAASTIKYKDSKTGQIFTVTKRNGKLYRKGVPVTPTATQKPYNPGKSKESNTQRLARLRKEKNAKKA